ncbi:MAG: bacteriocin [Psychrobium sp.]|nr:bacteriocin [Psychrobium sp.]
MSYSIMDMGNSTKKQAKQSLDTLSKLEQNREQINAQNKQKKKGNQLSGMASGAMIGTQIMPGWGTAIGAAVGFLAGSF